MALHPDFPTSTHVVLDPALRWFPADEALPQKSALIASAVTTLHRAITDEATGERPA
jgi:type III restriction enzyme